MPQDVQATPFSPHAETVGGSSHSEPLQQPEEQDTDPHEHAPPMHAWPAAHAAPPPHLHTPPTQLSAVRPQLVQAAPPVPHAEEFGGDVQVDPEQQPDGQVVEPHPLHTPPEHVSGLGQELQVAPPEPQSPTVLPGWHLLLLSQHPEGHELELQTHLPPEQTCPDAHALPPPHVHAPPGEHPSAALPQSTQDEPLAPHEVTVGTAQLDPEQQPVEHDAESQMHAPLWHS